MWPGPVFHIELLRLARRPRYFLLRFVYGLTILTFLTMTASSFWGYGLNNRGEASIHMMASFGQALFGVLGWIQSLTLLLLTPAVVAGVIADERQRKTLDYLLTSCLTSPEIVLGKLFARLTLLGVFLAIGLPIMAVNSFFGGVDPNLIVLFFLGSASALFFLGSLSIAVSSSAQKPRNAISLAYYLEFCWLFVPSIMLVLIPTVGTRGIAWDGIHWVCQALDALSPYSLLFKTWSMSPSQLMTHFSIMIGSQLVASAFFLGFASFNVRPSARKERRSGTKVRSSRRFWKGLKVKRSWGLFKRPECFDDAMLWKELFCSRKSLGFQIISAALFIGIGSIATYLLSFEFVPALEELFRDGYNLTEGNSHRDYFNNALRLLMSVGYVVLVLMAATSASISFTSEREEDTWVSLIASPLTAHEMIRAKALASLMGTKWLLGFLYTLLFVGVLVGSISLVGIVMNLMVTAIYLGFAIALGIYFSLRSRASSRAMGFTIGILLVLNLSPMILAAILQDDRSENLIAGFSPAVEYLSLLSPRLSDLFRELSFARRNSITIAVIFVLFAHLIAALGLFTRCIQRFDAWNDRPGTSR